MARWIGYLKLLANWLEFAGKLFQGRYASLTLRYILLKQQRENKNKKGEISWQSRLTKMEFRSPVLSDAYRGGRDGEQGVQVPAGAGIRRRNEGDQHDSGRRRDVPTPPDWWSEAIIPFDDVPASD